MKRPSWHHWRRWLGLKPQRDRFAADVLAISKELGEDGTYDPATFTIQFASGSRHHLDNHYAEVCEKPREQDAITRRYLVLILDSREIKQLDADAARARLRPVLRDPIRPQLRRGEVYANKETLAFAGAMELYVVVDATHSMRWVTDAQLEQWGMTLEEAVSQAVDNLADATDSRRWRQLRPGLWRSDWNDDYDSSRILLDGSWSGLPIQGNPVAIVPGRSTLLIADDADDTALAELARVGEELFAQDIRRISAVPLSKTEQSWQPFEATQPTLGQQAIANLRRQGFGTLYVAQKEHLLAKQNEEGPGDYFIASLSGFTHPDGRLETYCTWSSGIVSVLPVTDRIMFFDSATNSSVGDCTWQRLRRRRRRHLEAPQLAARALPDHEIPGPGAFGVADQTGAAGGNAKEWRGASSQRGRFGKQDLITENRNGGRDELRSR